MSWLEIFALALLPAFLLLDFFNPPPKGVRTRWWRSRAFAVTAVNFVLALFVGQAWGSWMGGAHLFNGAALGTFGGAVLGVVVYEFFHYWYHRSAHRIGWLWRLGHQMHHSAESLDAWGAYYLHPIDTALFTTLSSLVLFPLLGLSPEAGGWAAATLTFLGIFQHAHVRTPRWLGYLIQCPESHAVHHARSVHAFNYADLPLWDMVFGTYCNPRSGRDERRLQGFYDGASSRIVSMLFFRDVSAAAHKQGGGQ
ncbi:sterol desaturase family protein [Paucibacter sp. PLA-PC-4]|uniref:sterol desaturase family protein n=1 Tax=Paucibacter sp. PLA-PC-4 TaxID=2993655 RepID=UPI00224B74A4|nr:sterol desaturase family protein [Paucibacter sp. PLA-PC-4]MCX2864925.1 sterol desaturase family protein [Paucibacter sp. PLA-PC-4]